MRLIFLLIIISFFGFVYGEGSQKENPDETIFTEEKISPDADYATSNYNNYINSSVFDTGHYPDSLILVKQLSKSTPVVYNAILALEKAIKTSDNITDDKGLLHLLYLRDVLYEAINNSGIFDAIYDEEGSPKYEGDQYQFEQEINYLGFHELWAEGFYFGINKGFFLEELFEKKASEPLKLRTRILNLIGYTLGSEYPLLNISAESEIIYLGEQLNAKYPDHKYTPEIQKPLKDALLTLFDFHAVIYEDEGDTSYINFDLSTRPYPNWTEIDNRENFIKDYPDSKYAPLMKKVLENLSCINYEKDSIFVVHVPSNDSSIIQFLNKGIDIPHFTELRDSKGVWTETICAYRFFSDKEKAEQALKRISEKIPGSKIVVQLIDRTY